MLHVNPHHTIPVVTNNINHFTSSYTGIPPIVNQTFNLRIIIYIQAAGYNVITFSDYIKLVNEMIN
jgi:hypothetical protein